MGTASIIVARAARFGLLGAGIGYVAGGCIGSFVGLFFGSPPESFADGAVFGVVEGALVGMMVSDPIDQIPFPTAEKRAVPRQGKAWNTEAMKRLAAEFFGTFALVFAGTGAIVINDVSRGTVSHVGIAFTFGLVVMAMIYAVGDVSGAHLNPAVTLGFFAARRLEGRWVLPYLVSQCAGAFLASGTLKLLFPDHGTLGATLPTGSALQSFVLEAILTLFLMFVILSVSTGSKEKGIMAGVAVGAVIAFEALFAGPISGASMNPARSLAPAIVGWHLGYLWVYLTAPLLGAGLAVLACRCVHDESCCAFAPSKESLLMNNVTQPTRVLFVCIENANRSQMAEAFARIHGAGKIEAYSAGSRPSGKVNGKAVEFMRERGYDLAAHRSKSLNDISDVPFDVAVTMGCGDACPLVRAKRRVDWNIPDPKDMEPDEFRAVRDLIEQKVRTLLTEL